MKKYWFIIKTEIMTNLQYIANILVSFVGNFIMLFILFNLWNYLYDDPNKIINGYSKAMMIWYVIVTEYLWMIMGGRRLVRQISAEVKSGGVTYKLNKPYSFTLYYVFEHLGSIFIKALIYIFLFLGIGYLFVGYFPSLNICNVLLIIVTLFASTLISTLVLTALGLLAFFIEDSGPLYWVYSKIILVLGTIFPIEYFPVFLQKILVFSPVFVVSYGPAKLFVDFSYSNALKVILAQTIYIIVIYLICLLIYRKGVKRINVNGG